VTRPRLTERRKAQTRREIAEQALALFMQHGYDAVSVDAVADAAGVSLRTLYRYFASKDELVVPIVAGSVGELIDLLAARPSDEALGVAVERAMGGIEPRLGRPGVSMLAQLLEGVPALGARVGFELAALEDKLAPVIRTRAGGDLGEDDARVTAAVIVACIRVALRVTAHHPATPFNVALHRAIRRAQEGAGLKNSIGARFPGRTPRPRPTRR
jgi:AcrR family transcriptional regulator